MEMFDSLAGASGSVKKKEHYQKKQGRKIDAQTETFWLRWLSVTAIASSLLNSI